MPKFRVISGGHGSEATLVRTFAQNGKVVVDYTVGDRYLMAPEAARKLAAALMVAAEMADPLPLSKPGESNPTN